MGSYELVIRENAKDDLRRIWRYGVETWGLEAADTYLETFDDHFQKLTEQPLRHPPVDDLRPGYRRSVCGKDSVYYRIVDSTVEIMAILGNQDTKKWL